MNNLLLKQLQDIAKNYAAIESILLFGSRAYGDHSELSDIDLAVKAPNLTDLQWLVFTEEIENTLDTLLKIDLILYDQAPYSLREQIDGCNKVLYDTHRA
ncbi:nucleotidyltransferase domain-containing protein [Sporosarcina oncorhynchi]|uniref:Nucleotidyltransferase domain-containing protein n=1 Tax=Sporosarcina oncorhynchi TaxID=3056444 RepID=A0ABZ0L8G1_9BACL|nr:nucleotidyltransferase domain-containing protein [Sporosarcina sp. T2O-4]WOV88368.1 nucleotidyltransferase domain-containing protein [Sporosarcina sp. T2O-4]